VAMKTFLGKRSVKEDILSYDAHRILTTPGRCHEAGALHYNTAACSQQPPVATAAIAGGSGSSLGAQCSCMYTCAAVSGAASLPLFIEVFWVHMESLAGLAAKLDRLMASKGSSFEKEVAYRASQAAGRDICCACWCS